MTPPHRPRRWLRLLPLAAVVGVLLGPVAWKGFIFASDAYDTLTASAFVEPIPFDKAKWDRKRSVHRIGMGRTLAADGSLVGRSREDVSARLGTPDNFMQDDEWRYFLGHRETERLFSTLATLHVRFDASGVVTSAALSEHD